MSNAMSLKAKIRDVAKEKNIPAQVILQNYIIEFIPENEEQEEGAND